MPPNIIEFELTEAMVQVIANALAQRPYGEVAPVVAELQRQIDEQKPRNEPSTP